MIANYRFSCEADLSCRALIHVVARDLIHDDAVRYLRINDLLREERPLPKDIIRNDVTYRKSQTHLHNRAVNRFCVIFLVIPRVFSTFGIELLLFKNKREASLK